MNPAAVAESGIAEAPERALDAIFDLARSQFLNNPREASIFSPKQGFAHRIKKRCFSKPGGQAKKIDTFIPSCLAFRNGQEIIESLSRTVDLVERTADKNALRAQINNR
jgi:hypothetical protein